MALPQSFSYALRLFPHPWFCLRLSLWLLGASALFLVLYSANVLLEPPDGVSLTIEVMLDVIWAFYAIDYVLTMYVAERIVPGALITSYPDALWWAFVSMTTIGYGVYYPVTMTGRLITVVLVLAGIAIIGVITGSCVAWVIREVGINDEKDAPVTKGQADKLERKLEMLSDKVSDLNRRMRSH